METAETAKYEKRIDRFQFAAPKSVNRIIQYIPDVNMQNGHNGLTRIAAKFGISCDSLNEGEFVLFMNKSRTILKLFAPGNVIGHLKNAHRSEDQPEGHCTNS